MRPAAGKRGEKVRDAGGQSFAAALAGPETTAQTASANPVAGAGALLALQEIADPTERRRAALQRGNRLLDRLEEIRQGLLMGTIARGALEALRTEVADARGVALDPALAEILGEIELRAAVELAKLEAA